MVHPRKYLLSMENVEGLIVAMDPRQTYVSSLLPVTIALMKAGFRFRSRIREKRAIVRNTFPHLF